jgi:phytoene dehydrogenase-like protein
MKHHDVAIIGGGLSGLIAAIYLAKADHSVVVLEKSKRWGGRAMTNQKNGALFNLGGHALYRGGEAYATFKELGFKLEGGTPATSGFVSWNNKLIPIPGSPVKMLTSRLLSWSGKIEMVKLMLKLTKLNSSTIRQMSIREWAESEIIDPMVRHLFYALCRTATYAYDPDHQLAGPALKQMQRSLKASVIYLDGGWQTLVDQLYERASRLGVRFLSQAQVAGLEREQGLQKVVLSSGEIINASCVISTLAPAETYRLIRETDSPTLLRWKKEARPVTGACLDLCLKRLPEADHHFVLGLDKPIFYSHHSRVAELSEKGTFVMHLVKYHAFGEHDPQADELALEQAMSLIHPGWQKEVVAKQFLPNMTVVQDYPHTEKSDLKPGPVVPEIQGLYVAGDWAGHGEMLADAAAASARRAAVQVIHDLANPSEREVGVHGSFRIDGANI